MKLKLSSVVCLFVALFCLSVESSLACTLYYFTVVSL
jgi:hypothetical protein